MTGINSSGKEFDELESTVLKDFVLDVLDDRKGLDIVCLEVREMTTVADYMVVATGTSRRHVQSLSEEVVRRVKEGGHAVRGVEGEDTGEWVLVDLGDVVVHVMQQATRQLYDLEGLWDMGATRAG